MSNEEKRKSGGQIGTLGGCLIEGDSEQNARERKINRRALAISVGLQSAAIVALVVTPLLAKPEKLAFLITTPMPPYRAMSPKPVGDRVPVRPNHGVCFSCIHNVSSKPITIDVDPISPQSPEAPDIGSIPVPGEVPGGNKIGGQRTPTPPDDLDRNKKRRVVLGGDVVGALLVHRAEPQYPALARQLGRSGTVHIRAVISTEGNIQSVQVLDGDPLLIQSARDAVSQWHYRPTLLNGVPVEVETIIAVTYTLNR